MKKRSRSRGGIDLCNLSKAYIIAACGSEFEFLSESRLKRHARADRFVRNIATMSATAYL
jgi:hypothetical protein